MTRAGQSRASAGGEAVYRLILFVAGDEPNSQRARQNLDELCENELKGRCRVEIVDVMEDFEKAAEHGILLTPTLLRVEPLPGITVIGNLNDHEKVRAALRRG